MSKGGGDPHPGLSVPTWIAAPEWLAPPEWLVELVKPKKAPVPWPSAFRAAAALGTPLFAAWAAGRLSLGLFMAMGALSGTIGDRRGPYRVRALQIGLSALFGAIGIVIGQAVFDKGWITFVVVCAVALFAALSTVAGTIGATSSLQVLIFMLVASGRGFPPPFWQPPVLFLIGGAWALTLAMIGVLRDPVSPERQRVVAYLKDLADLADTIGADTIGTDTAEAQRRKVTTALNDAYDALLSGRVRSGGRHRSFRWFMGLLNSTTPLLEHIVAAIPSGRRPPEHVAPALREVADAVLHKHPVPALPSWHGTTTLAPIEDGSYPDPGIALRLRNAVDQILSGPTTRMFTLRFVLCIAIAELVRQLMPSSRSYWIALTVAIVLKSDFGSVFARAVQRAAGTLLGAAIGAVLIAVVPRGIGDVLVIAALAAVLPVALLRQYGMFSTFLTPLVVLLIDLLRPGGWSTLDARLIDTALGSAIVLVFGYLLWPQTFHNRIGPRFAGTVQTLADYTRAALGAPGGGDRNALRRDAYRKLSDLRTVFQQALAEPPPISRRASAWYPSIVALERMTDAVTRAAIRIDHGAPRPAPEDVAALADGIGDLVGSLRERRPLELPELGEDPALTDIASELEAAGKIITGPTTQAA